jgi:ATP-dependent RNA helicase RhlE
VALVVRNPGVPGTKDPMKFSDLRLAEPLLRSISNEGYDTPTPIQAQAIPYVLDARDLLGCAQTGTGKTAAFALPILQRLWSPDDRTRRNVRCLVLCPTRELALQISGSFSTYGRHLPLKHAVVFGGVSQNPQAALLRQGVDILIATPGRSRSHVGHGFHPRHSADCRSAPQQTTDAPLFRNDAERD